MATLSLLDFLVPGRARDAVRRRRASERPLEVTSDGADLVRLMQDGPSEGSDGGLRIVIDPQYRSLSMSLADRQADDVVITGHGVQVFLSAAADERLRGCTLRAGAVGSGSWFYLDGSASAPSLGSRRFLRSVPPAT